jgi:hypothetical protein
MADDIREIARRAVQCFAEETPAIMQRRAENHRRSGDAETAEFWRTVGDEARTILEGEQPGHPAASARR